MAIELNKSQTKRWAIVSKDGRLLYCTGRTRRDAIRAFVHLSIVCIDWSDVDWASAVKVTVTLDPG